MIASGSTNRTPVNAREGIVLSIDKRLFVVLPANNLFCLSFGSDRRCIAKLFYDLLLLRCGEGLKGMV